MVESVRTPECQTLHEALVENGIFQLVTTIWGVRNSTVDLLAVDHNPSDPSFYGKAYEHRRGTVWCVDVTTQIIHDKLHKEFLQAIVLHEVGHCDHYAAAWGNPGLRALLENLQDREFYADDFVVKHGYSRELRRTITRQRDISLGKRKPFSAINEARLQRLLQ